ncbi:MAG: hypothetical protein AVDCRST_MAG10-2722, partial [uncultured Acidimicrobiales bacterium]
GDEDDSTTGDDRPELPGHHRTRTPARHRPWRPGGRDPAPPDPSVAPHAHRLRRPRFLPGHDRAFVGGQHSLGRVVSRRHVDVHARGNPVALAGGEWRTALGLAQPRRAHAGRLGPVQRGRGGREPPDPHRAPRARRPRRPAGVGHRVPGLRRSPRARRDRSPGKRPGGDCRPAATL